jgi:hypothetical protein
VPDRSAPGRLRHRIAKQISEQLQKGPELGGILDRVSHLVTVRPWLTLAVLALVTMILVAGAGLRAPVAPNEAFLPTDGDVARAKAEVDALFSDDADVKPGYIVFRGDWATPSGLDQVERVLGQIASDPAVAGLFPSDNAIIAPTPLLNAVLRVDDFGSLDQRQIDSALSSIRAIPDLAATLSQISGFDQDGGPIAFATVQLRGTDEGLLESAQLRVDELATAVQGPLAVTTVSSATIESEFQDATASRTAPLIGVALLVIASLTFLFLRTFSDLVATLVGIVIALTWIIGLEGWLGPEALGLIGPPNALTGMVPIVLISLTVDYSIQAVSHYREQRTAGLPVARAAQLGLRNVLIPLTLAALTTMVSFLTNLFSPISAIGDFGVVAGLGVALSLTVMLTLVPAVRTVIDRRREARGALAPARPIANALPGIRRVAEALGTSVAAKATPYILAVIVITVALGFSATRVTTDYDVRDLLPRDGQTARDLEAINAAVGGTSELVNVLIKAEITDTRTLLNLFELAVAFEDDLDRPATADGPLTSSLGLLIRDHVTESGKAYDPELARAFDDATGGLELDPAKIQAFLALLATKDPEGVRRVLVDDPGGVDTILIQFMAYSAGNEQTERLVNEVDRLWYGDHDTVTMTSSNIERLAVTKEITERQTEAIITTIIAALLILAVFFWVTDREPVLAVIAVGPIALILIWVLGTMALLGIPYSIVTSIITALSIGIGVDYTIHVIHRYREEFTKSRNPETAAIQTLATTGSALLGSALTTALGFGILVLSPLDLFAQFGLVAAITIAYSLIVATLLVPPAMTVWGAFRNMRLQSMVERMWSDLDVAIEETHRKREGA